MKVWRGSRGTINAMPNLESFCQEGNLKLINGLYAEYVGYRKTPHGDNKRRRIIGHVPALRFRNFVNGTSKLLDFTN